MHDSPRHWSVAIDNGRIGWITLDRAEATSNTLSADVLSELGRVLDFLQDQAGLTGIVFRSGKASGFVLGADVAEFGQIADAAAGTAAARTGQDLMNRIASLPFRSVALIDGFALGGGLELALACTYRVAVHSYDRTLGLPEVQLGIHPGFGGTVRAVDLLGPLQAMELMLTGKSLSPVQAVRSGLIDRCVDRASLVPAAIALLQSRQPRRRAPWYLRLLNVWPLRELIARKLLASVAGKARPEHYPAPFAIVELWRRYGCSGTLGLVAEIRSIGELLVSPTCRNLVRMFRLRERLRNLAPKNKSAKAVHVIGAGVMGGDIAAWCALQGLQVTLQDREQKFIDPALERARKLFERRLRAPGAAALAAARLRADVAGDGVANADVVIEAIVERRDVKQEVFADVEKRAPGEAVLGTNTSSIRIEDIAEALQEPGRLVGIHFFNPVAQLPLVEVVRGPGTDPQVLERAISFVTRIGKLPLPCGSAPGFVVNRVLMPYLIESLRAHEDGIPFETIDAAAVRFGMPMGPVELADRVGLDVALHVATILGEAFGTEPPALLREKVEAGLLGTKSPEGGFYRYQNGRPVRNRQAAGRPGPELEDRLILPLVNECIACLEERIVDDADLIDAGVVFGTGFAPFRGGPLQYARDRGVADVVAALERLESQFGARFKPHPAWSDF